MSDFYPTATMEDFMLSGSYVRVLGGPIGGGKSVACAHELMHWAHEQAPNAAKVRKTRFLIVRNTVDQLRSTTMKTVFDWFPPGQYGEYKATEKTFFIRVALDDGTIVQSEWMFIALDTPDDVRKALSLEATGLWGNECRELHPDVVDGLLMRVNRYPSMKDGGATRAGAIFDTNMPDEEGWWYEKMENPPKNWSIHIQPPAVLPLAEWVEKYNTDPPDDLVAEDNDENVFAVDPGCDNFANLSRSYYPNTLQGKTMDFINVYLRCRYGRSLSGLPVYDKTFRAERHVAKSPLVLVKSESYPLCVGIDFGRTPAAVIGQLTPRGRVNVLSELTSENMGIETFIRDLLKPHLYEHYLGMSLVVSCDPAGWQKSQVDERSPVDVLKANGFQVFRPPTNKPELRIQAVETLLTQSVDDTPRLQIDPGCRMLIQGFKFGYKWKLDKNQDMTGSAPVKNEWSHVSEALQYFAMCVDKGLAGTHISRRRDIQVASAAGWT